MQSVMSAEEKAADFTNDHLKGVSPGLPWDADMCDVILDVEGHKFPCHSLILSHWYGSCPSAGSCQSRHAWR